MRRTLVGLACTLVAVASAILVTSIAAMPSAEDNVRRQVFLRDGDLMATTRGLSFQLVFEVERTPIRAGSIVTASVRIILGHKPVRPTGVTCAGTIGDAKVRGVPKATRGKASCAYRTPLDAKGKMLRGAVAFTARGDRYVRRFATLLR